jgi:hypothetical protein
MSDQRNDLYQPGWFAAQARDPAQQQEAMNIAMSVGPGSIGGKLAAANIAGKDLSLARAQSLESNLYHPNEIFQRTGWWRGPDRNWRFTIPDIGAKLNTANLVHMGNLRETGEPLVRNMADHEWDVHPNNTTGNPVMQLSDVLNHPDLYKAYPWARDIDVSLMPPNRASRAVYRPQLDTIMMTGDDPSLGRALTSREYMSTLLHEVQHAIQLREGFARGGSNREFLPPNFDQMVQHMNNRMDAFEGYLSGTHGLDPEGVKASLDLYPYGPDGPMGQVQYPMYSAKDLAEKVPKEELERYKNMTEEHRDLADLSSSAYQQYVRLAGEAESRYAQHMYEAGLYDIPPWDMPAHARYGFIPFEQQIVRPQQFDVPPWPK